MRLARGLLVLLVCCSCSPAKKPLNVIWLVADDMSLELGVYGDRIARTPNLDRLAAQGVRFTNVFATSPTCAPSRTALITGVQATSIGAQHHRSEDGGYRPVPPPDLKTFTEQLREANYYAGNVVKLDYQFSGILADAPITNWDEQIFGDWGNRRPGQAFFLYATDLSTHESHFVETPSQLDSVTETDPASIVLPPYYPDTPLVRIDFARYYDAVAHMDAAFGKLLDRLAAEGLENDTIVFFFSDNGRPFPRDKRWLYDGGLHGPLIVRWPGHLAAGTTNDELISYLDFAPTVLSVAGLPVPAKMAGRVFLGDHARPAPDFVFSTADRRDEEMDRMRAVRDVQFKYIRNYRPDVAYGAPIAYRDRLATIQELHRLHDANQLSPPADWFFQPSKAPEELYDSLTDPLELTNLAADPSYANVLERMRAAETQWEIDSDDTGAIPEAELQERFWPGKVQPTTAPPVVAPMAAKNNRVPVRISSDVAGASLSYSITGGDAVSDWHIYTAPVVLERGQTLHAVAVRYGWAQSAESTFSF
jgi:arylsulfatase A-like enzyme